VVAPELLANTEQSHATNVETNSLIDLGIEQRTRATDHAGSLGSHPVAVNTILPRQVSHSSASLVVANQLAGLLRRQTTLVLARRLRYPPSLLGHRRFEVQPA
jgi:hypothetical protein